MLIKYNNLKNKILEILFKFHKLREKIKVSILFYFSFNFDIIVIDKDDLFKNDKIRETILNPLDLSNQ